MLLGLGDGGPQVGVGLQDILVGRLVEGFLDEAVAVQSLKEGGQIEAPGGAFLKAHMPCRVKALARAAGVHGAQPGEGAEAMLYRRSRRHIVRAAFRYVALPVPQLAGEADLRTAVEPGRGGDMHVGAWRMRAPTRRRAWMKATSSSGLTAGRPPERR